MPVRYGSQLVVNEQVHWRDIISSLIKMASATTGIQTLALSHERPALYHYANLP